MDIQLFNLFNADNSTALEDRGFLPIGLISIATLLQKNGYTTEILDSQINPIENLAKEISAPVVGFNFTVMSTDLLDSLTLKAKQKGAITVIGGQAATPIARQLLEKNANIDYVIRFNGEMAMLQLLEVLTKGNGTLESIPNLVYRNNDLIVENIIHNAELYELPMPNRSVHGINMDWYIRNFKVFGYPGLEYPEFRVTNTFSQRGCIRRGENHGCSFCARIDTKFNARTDIQTYFEYKYLQDQYGINYIFDDSDSWIRPEWMKGLDECYDQYGPLNIKLRVYADIRDINQPNVELMKKLNVASVLIGIESGSERVLTLNGKPLKVQRILNAMEILAKNGINVSTAYVLGLIGETEESLNQTFTFSKKLAEYGNLQTSYWNTIIPLPGSPIWQRMMLIPELRLKYFNEYKFDINQLRNDFVINFCDLGTEGLKLLESYRNFAFREMDAPIRDYVR
jgi:anaerobic magnesium-protoporphyrin IX monomethyl ester cyclase